MTSADALPTDARIAIMGAGCAGLTCAEELREHGYRRVTLFEAQRRAGGKIRSVPYAGAPAHGRGLFEGGTVFFIPSPMWTKLLRRYCIPEATLAMPRVRIADLSTGRTANLLRFANGHSVFTRVRQGARLAMLLRGYGREHDRVPGIAAHSGGSTEIQVTGTGPSPMQIGQKRIAPFQVQLQSGNIALENWIQAALGNGVPYRDIVFQATVNGPVLYNFVDSFLTRVVLIGPTLLSTDVGKAPNGVALTMQPNRRQ